MTQIHCAAYISNQQHNSLTMTRLSTAKPSSLTLYWSVHVSPIAISLLHFVMYLFRIGSAAGLHRRTASQPAGRNQLLLVCTASVRISESRPGVYPTSDNKICQGKNVREAQEAKPA